MYQAIDPVGALDEEGRGQRSEDGDRHHNGIDLLFDHAQAHAQGRDDEGKFADLCQRAAAVDGLGEALPREQHAQGGDEELAHDGHHRDDEDGDDVTHDHLRVQHHADGEKEDRAEEILDPGGQVLHPLGMYRAGQQRAGQEGAQRRGEAQRFRQQNHAEADTQGSQQQGLVIHEFLRLAQEGREDIDAQDQP